MLKISKEKTPYHTYCLESDYDVVLVEYCQFLNMALGWQEFNWDKESKKWRFRDVSIVSMIKGKFPSLITSKDVDEDVEEYKERYLKKIEIEKEVNEVKEAEKSKIEVKGIKGDLYEYQKLGIEFLTKSGGRALLADSPGVGKTVQALGFITHNEYKRSLIVCPASVKFSWESEIDKWTN